MSDLSRRRFIQTTTAALAASAIARRAPGVGANGVLRGAVLGVNGRGMDHVATLQRLPGVQLAVFCDPDSKVVASRAEQYEKKYGKKVATETDLRRVFDRKDIDFVTVATPNHWHALATIWACQAGKDVYVEKPGTHNIFEGRKMIEAAKKYGRIVQHGVQLRSSPAIREAVEHLRKGTIGKVYMARGIVYRWRPSIGKKGPEPVPAHLNWDLWQGPAAERPFSSRYVHYNWHWHWDYGNGDVGNQGVHETDMCLWGLDVQFPSQITAMGGKFLWDDDKETPEVLSSSYLFPEQQKMIEFEVRPWCTNTEEGATVGNIFYGSEGILVVKGYGTYEIYLGQKREPGPKNSVSGEMDLHFANFLEAVRSRKTDIQNGPVETAHYSSGLAHLGNIAYRLGRQLRFSPATEKFEGDDEANAMLTRKYRPPYVVPETV